MLSQLPSQISAKIKKHHLQESKTDRNLYNLNKDILKTKFGYPASKRLAHVHKRSIKFGYQPQEEGTGEVCACCLKGVQTAPLTACTNTLPSNFDYRAQEQFPLMAGVAMFFLFIKMIIIYLVFRILILDLFNLITNLNQGTSEESQQWVDMSFLNKINTSEMKIINNILSFIMVCLSIVFFISFRKIQYLTHEKIDASSQTADDYALFVEGIPVLKIEDTQVDPKKVKLQLSDSLQNFFTYQVLNWVEDPSYWQKLEEGTIEYDYVRQLHQDPQAPPRDIVKSVSLCYDISELKKIQDLRRQIMRQHEILVNNDPNDSLNIYYRKQVQLLNNSELLKTEQMATNQNFNFEVSHFVGSAFISFKYQHYRDKLLQLYEQDKHNFLFRSAYLRITDANHPSEIKWKNLNISHSERRYRRLVSISVLAMTLILSFAIILSLNLIDAFSTIFEDKAWIVNILIVLIVMGINFGLKQIIYNLVSLEKHKTKSSKKLSLIIKLLTAQFINQSLIYYIVSLFESTHAKSWIAPSGLINQITTLLVISGFIGILLNIFHTGILMRKFTIWNQYKDTNDRINEYQIHVNRKFEYPQFDFAQRYTYYLVQLYTVAFYAYLVPIGVIALAIIFLIQYWVDKYNLFTRSSLFYELNFRLTRKILKFFEGSILVYSFGALIFSSTIEGYVPLFNLLSFIISAVYVLLITIAPNSFQKKIFQPYEKLQKYDFDDNIRRGKTQMSYWKYNPVTRFLEENATKSIGTRHLTATMSVYERLDTLG